MGTWNAAELLWTVLALVGLPFAFYSLREARRDQAIAHGSAERRQAASSAWITSDAMNYVVVLLCCAVIGVWSGVMPDRQIELAPNDPYRDIRIPASVIAAIVFFTIEISTIRSMFLSLRHRRSINRASDTQRIITEPSDLGLDWLFWSSRDALVVMDVPTDTVVLWNAQAEALWGYGREQLDGLAVELLMPQRYRARHLAGLEHYAMTRSGALMTARKPIPLYALRYDGSEVPIEMMLGGVPNSRCVLAVIRERASDPQE